MDSVNGYVLVLYFLTISLTLWLTGSSKIESQIRIHRVSFQKGELSFLMALMSGCWRASAVMMVATWRITRTTEEVAKS